MAININTIKGINNLETVILKAYVYVKEFVRADGNSYKRYITVISEVPQKEFSPRVLIPNGKNSPTYGVFIEVIGNGDIMRPNGRITLNKYQEYIESQGYTFVGTAPGVKGATFDETRIAAYQVIKKDMKGDDKNKDKIATIKQDMFKALDGLEYIYNNGQSITIALKEIREIIHNF